MTPEQKAERLKLIKEVAARWRGMHVRYCEACMERFMTSHSFQKFCDACKESENRFAALAGWAEREFDRRDDEIERVKVQARDGQPIEDLISKLGMGGISGDEQNRYVSHKEHTRHTDGCALVRSAGPCDCQPEMRTKRKSCGPRAIKNRRGKVYREMTK